MLCGTDLQFDLVLVTPHHKQAVVLKMRYLEVKRKTVVTVYEIRSQLGQFSVQLLISSKF